MGRFGSATSGGRRGRILEKVELLQEWSRGKVTDLDAIMDEMLVRTRLDLRGYRRNMIERRVRSRMDRLCIRNDADYLRRIREDVGECDALAAAISINVSAFFRDPLVFEMIDAVVLPEVLRESPREVRVWSAGCAHGEEPYSVAILLRSALRKAGSACVAHIFATDIDADALARAREGVYARKSLMEVRLGVLDECFLAMGEKWQLQPEIRRMVDFSIDDLMAPDRVGPAASVFAGYNVILCRNVLIYMESTAQEQTMARLCRSLAPGGFLVLGDSESPVGEVARGLHVVDGRCRIYRRERDLRR